MIDKTQNKKDILAMRQLFWKKVNGKISHEKLMEELERIVSSRPRVSRIWFIFSRLVARTL